MPSEQPPHLSPLADPAAPSANTHYPKICHLGRLLDGRRVLDLGSGTGLAGLSAAAFGAHVLLTDLASVCEGVLRANIQRNALLEPSFRKPEELASAASTASAASSSSATVVATVVPTASIDTHPAVVAAAADHIFTCGQDRSSGGYQEGAVVPGPGSGPWVGAVSVGKGTAAVMALDWTEPLEPQVRAAGNDPREADFILAVVSHVLDPIANSSESRCTSAMPYNTRNMESVLAKYGLIR